MKRTFFFALILVALAATANLPAAAQRRDSTLTGVVLGLDGKPVANASVTYQSGGGTAPHVTHTDAKGHFSAVKLRADIYNVRASSQGVYSAWEKNVNVRPGQTKVLTLRLTHPKDAPVAPPATQP
ncbi:MAG: carboxypeptidase-like regulatory domain-containing protein [Candidatus Acidiferrum sp.]|jgi:uncharacterized GH25 family protein